MRKIHSEITVQSFGREDSI